MASVTFIIWLRSRFDAVVTRCAVLIQRHRMQRARAQLPQQAREKASFWRALYLARSARLQREREARRRARAPSANGPSAGQDISKAAVLAAIARSRANREARLKVPHDEGKG